MPNPIGADPVIEHIVRVFGPVSMQTINIAITELRRAGAYLEPVEIRMTPPALDDLRHELHGHASYMPGRYQPFDPENLWGFRLNPCLPTDTDSWEVVWSVK